MTAQSHWRSNEPRRLYCPPGKKIRLKNYDSNFTGKFKNKDEVAPKLTKEIQQLAKYQDILYAQDTYALLLVFQAMDVAGKDSLVKHVMSGINPQGCEVHSFKTPSSEDLNHDYLWRTHKSMPERGRIGIFNRSDYEEVLVVRVHPEFLDLQRLPEKNIGKKLWQYRFQEINEFERYAVRNGTEVLKFFLNVSKEEQRQRFLARIETPEKELEILDARHRRAPSLG